MTDGVLITFGCSWMYGIGVGYEEGMDAETFESIRRDADICGKFSYRGLLSSKFNLSNINFSEGGSSNQKQLRRAKIFFSSAGFEKLQRQHNNIIVVWGITSTARTEMFDLETGILTNFKYDAGVTPKISEMMVKYSYDHTNEVAQLSMEMKFWNSYFASIGVKNIWVDSFNTHDYMSPIPNLFNDNCDYRDLMSSLVVNLDMPIMDSSYHASSWREDCDRVSTLLRSGHLDPFSMHPTKSAHRTIALMLDHEIALRLQ